MQRTLVKAVSPVGVHIGRERIRVVQVASGTRRTFVSGCGVIPRRSDGPIPSESDIADLARAFDRWGLNGRRVSIALPREMLKVDMLDLPPQGSGAPIERLASMEMARLHSLEQGSFESRCWSLPHSRRARERSSVVAVACIIDPLNEMLDQFEICGLDVVRADTESWADVRACGRLDLDSTLVHAIVDLRWSIARLTFVHDGIVVYERAMPEKGLDRQSRIIASRMGVDIDAARYLLMHPPEESADPVSQRIWKSEIKPLVNTHTRMLTDDLRSAFGYATHQITNTRPGSVVMIGCGSNIMGFAQHIHQALDVEVKMVSTCDLISADGFDLKSGCADEYITALGMALVELEA